jgi:ferredoxin
MSMYKIIFSPTGGTEKVAGTFIQAFEQEVKTIDLTDYQTDFQQIQFSEDDICVVAVPSFGGRVPETAATRLEKIKANGAKAILIAVYGNRDYDDTLLELKTILTNSKFCCIAAVAAIAEHSIIHQFAQGRPDKEDLEELSLFAKQIRQRIQENRIPENLILPGNNPYREYNGVPIKPVAKKNCTNCGLCAKKCPVQAIPIKNSSQTDYKKCISCMRCINICPTHAREVNKLLVTLAASKMKKDCSTRKQNELFIEG